ncbi:MAG: hypothetical protein R2710_01040 [Acidimicrobiales bacterium]
MSQRRLATFSAGAAAAAALGALGEPPSPVTIGTGGAPQWPSAGIVGSISHTDTTAYAIVGLAEPSKRAPTSLSASTSSSGDGSNPK